MTRQIPTRFAWTGEPTARLESESPKSHQRNPKPFGGGGGSIVSFGDDYAPIARNSYRIDVARECYRDDFLRIPKAVRLKECSDCIAVDYLPDGVEVQLAPLRAIR